MFEIIGFLVKEWPWSEPFNIGSNWDEVEKVEESLLSSGLVRRNILGLLEPIGESEFIAVRKQILNLPDAKMVMMAVDQLLADHLRSLDRIGWSYLPSHNEDFLCIGYDVIDAHGLFTFLNHPLSVAKRKTEDLFSISELDDAKRYQEFAGYVAPEHSPYIVAAIYLQQPFVNPAPIKQHIEDHSTQ